MPHRRRRPAPGPCVIAVAALSAIVWIGAAATSVAAHVNRTVGPYGVNVPA